jgi:hypothetical protein
MPGVTFMRDKLLQRGELFRWLRWCGPTIQRLRNVEHRVRNADEHSRGDFGKAIMVQQVGGNLPHCCLAHSDGGLQTGVAQCASYKALPELQNGVMHKVD